MKLLLDIVKKHQEHYEDLEIELGKLKYADFIEEQFYLTDLHKSKTYEISDLSARQFYGLLGIPFDYIKKCGFFLIKANTDYWTESLYDKKVLMRFSDEKVRGILSNRYNTVYDNSTTVPLIVNSINSICNEENCEIQREDFLIKNELSYITFQSIKNRVTYGDNVFTPGIEITNSEVGLLSFKIRPFINIHSFNRNSYKSLTSLSHNGLTKISHLKQLEKVELEAIIYQGIKNAHEAAFLGIKEAIELAKEPVSNPKEELKKIGEACNLLGKRIQNVIYEEGNYASKEITKLDLITDILNAMKEADMYKQIILQEKLGSHFGLFKKTQETKSQIINVSKKEEVDFRFNFEF